MPYIESVIPLKRAGNYGRNEKIVIMDRFNKPVTVTGGPLQQKGHLLSLREFLKLLYCVHESCYHFDQDHESAVHRCDMEC